MADLSLGIPQSKVKPLLDADTVIRLQARIYDTPSLRPLVATCCTFIQSIMLQWMCSMWPTGVTAEQID